jgi:hypothetical protein
MRKLLARHKLAYSLLIAGLSFFSFLIYTAWPNRVAQRNLIMALVGFYFLWGSLTHFKSYKLTIRVVLEYLGVSLLAGLLLILITL